MTYYCHTEPEYAENDHPIGTKTIRLTREEVLARFLAPWSLRGACRVPGAMFDGDAIREIIEHACIHDWMIIQKGWIETVESLENIS